MILVTMVLQSRIYFAGAALANKSSTDGDNNIPFHFFGFVFNVKHLQNHLFNNKKLNTISIMISGGIFVNRKRELFP